ncbi:hypothetical protein [Janthinobacterium agaricidamnosum]|uniref:Sel1 repeat family protein n=1 Tax=Janthinobacterium agaricidamnosum NBRC 102515 = DSM 9628 TaxID=1349767 RepID=W0VE11_9BURK|nr:hypothetical protein [Janthinobacterium agaricidamnosum]CDG85638.1 sel1 repeat family protein [Janthinobacterium agaricidamnosum NBRC 102515 = DSM 9628]
MIKGARAGDGECQLVLGKLYLFGRAGLPQSLATALHWLQRAALQNNSEAKLLIGAHIPYELAYPGAAMLMPFYRHAYRAGIRPAGLVLAQLVFGDSACAAEADAALQADALRALEEAARAGLPDALWLLARHGGAAPGVAACTFLPEGQSWLTQAADSGVGAALQEVLEQAWSAGDRPAFLARALPMARRLLERHEAAGHGRKPPQAALALPDLLLLSRCGQVLGLGGAGAEQAEAVRFFELAARGGDRAAQLALGLWFARMDAQGTRLQAGCGAVVNRGVNFKRAIRWLTQAGEQGLADAWFALSRIYIKPEFSQRSVQEAQSCLERAAGMGHSAAQLECGILAWRNRRDAENSDVRAAYWLLKAAAQGSVEAERALRKIAPPATAPYWGQAIGPLAALELAGRQPLLAARLELGRRFQLSRAEALLLDVHGADQGHCLVVDIRASHGRGKRRLVLLRTVQERQALDRLLRLFDGVDCSLDGPEGNYRQRLYRLKTYLLASHPAGAVLPERSLLAA